MECDETLPVVPESSESQPEQSGPSQPDTAISVSFYQKLQKTIQTKRPAPKSRKRHGSPESQKVHSAIENVAKYFTTSFVYSTHLLFGRL